MIGREAAAGGGIHTRLGNSGGGEEISINE